MKTTFVPFLMAFFLLACSKRHSDTGQCVPSISHAVSPVKPRIAHVDGKGFISSPKNVARAACGLFIENADTITTGPCSRMQVAFNDSDYIIIGENSIVTIHSSLDSMIISIAHGKLYSNAIVLPKQLLYKIITPKFQAQSRGTAFSVEAFDSSETRITVFEGKVEVIDSMRSCPINVLGGQRATLKYGEPCQTRVVRIKELDDLIHWIGSSSLRLRNKIEMLGNMEFLKKLAQVDSSDLDIKAMVKVSEGTLALKPKEIPEPLKRSSATVVPISEIPLKKPAITEDSLRDAADIDLTIKENIFRITIVYNRYLRETGKKLVGDVKTRFTIHPDGLVDHVEVLETTLADSEFQEKLAEAVKKIKFKKVDEKVGAITIVYPFEFNTQN
ncbi:MAG: TonB family protein [Chitinivibrionales bacterium]